MNNIMSTKRYEKTRQKLHHIEEELTALAIQKNVHNKHIDMTYYAILEAKRVALQAAINAHLDAKDNQ